MWGFVVFLNEKINKIEKRSFLVIQSFKLKTYYCLKGANFQGVSTFLMISRRFFE